MGNTSGKPHHRSRNKKQVRWKAADRPLPPGKPQLFPDAYSSPDVITIRWSPPKSHGGSPITGYLVEHRRCGSTHWVRATPLLVPFPEVSLGGLEPGWRYQFRVSAENAVGLSMPSEISEPLTVTLQRSAVTAPRFTEELRDTVVLENEKIEFVVHFLGQPAPKISWFKDGFEIFSSRRTRIITDNDRSSLTIHQTALSDEGEIKCTATNRAGHASTRAFLKLEAPPSIRLPRQYEDGLLFEIGEVIRLKVSVAGRPTPLVFWSHNGESIKSDDRYEIENTDRFSTLKVNEARRTDRGEYQIKAVNKLGEDINSFLVTITDKPSPPGRARVVMTLGRSVTLSWKSPEDDGGCKIGNYIVEYYRIGWDVWLKAATCRQLTTVLGDLIEGSEYKFRVKAESPYGISDPSEESETVFIPDPRRGILSSRTRAKSQPPDLIQNDFISISYEPKTEPPMHSSSKSEKRVTISETTDIIPPVRPKRTKSKSAPQTPTPSPAATRRTVNVGTIDKGIFDRSSMAREMAYGSPGLKTRKIDKEVESVGVNFDPKVVKDSSLPQRSTHTHFDEIDPRSQLTSSEPNTNKSHNTTNTLGKTVEKIATNQRPQSPPKGVQRNTSSSVQNSREKLTEGNRIQPPSPSRTTTNSKQTSVESFSPSALNSSSNRANVIQASNLKSEDHTETLTPPSPLSKSHPNSFNFLNSIDRSSKSKSPSPDQTRSKSSSPERSKMSNQLQYPTVPRSRDNSVTGSSEFMLVLLPEEKREGQENQSDIRFDFSEVSFPPPLSLSAPELGVEPPQIEILRSASSTDILREQQMQRVYEAMAAEEEELERRRKSIDKGKEEPKLDIPKIQINSMDAESATERIPSFRRRMSAGSQPHHSLLSQRRHSLKNTELRDLPENRLHRFELSSEERRELFQIRQWSDSQEKEEKESEKYPQSINRTNNNITKKQINVADEQEWEPESSESEERNSFSSSESSEDERLREETIPSMHEEEDEPTYHPGLMISNRNGLKSNEEPFEILTKRCPLPDPNFVPKPILKRREDEFKQIPEKPIRRDLLEQKYRERSNSLYSKTNSLDYKQRSSSPRPPQYSKFEKRGSLPAVKLSTIPAIPENVLENNSSVQTKSNEEIEVVVDHYGDLLRNYSHVKRNAPPLYLDRDELKEAAEEQSKMYSREAEKPVESTATEFSEGRANSKQHIEQNTKEKVSRSRTASTAWNDEEEAISPQRRGSSSLLTVPVPTYERKRRGSGTIDNKKSHSRSPSKSRDAKTRGPSKSPARQENWSNLRVPPSPHQGRKASPSPQRRNSLTNTEMFTTQRKKLREITTQTSKSDDSYLPYPRIPTPQQEEMVAQAEVKVRTTIDYLTDLAMFFVACWLYLFHNELLAIPVLLIMVYRQLKEEIRQRLPKWMLPKRRRKTKKK